MHATSLRRSSAPFALAAALLAAALVLIPAGRASAHDELVASSPAADATVETLPEELTLTFSSALIDAPASTAVAVTDAGGKSLSEGDAEINGAVITQKLRTAGASAGEYTVLWQVVSSDGHPTDGTFTFTVTTGSPAAEPTPVESESVDASPTPDAVATTAPPAEDPNMASGFSVSAPWMIGGAVVLLIAIFLLIVWIRARGRRSTPDADSETSSER